MAGFESNFVADVRMDDNDEVLQLPIVKNRLKKLLSTAVKKIAMHGQPIIPSSEDTLEEFLQAAGKFFGKDPTEWLQMGEPKIAVSEEGGKRVITSTGIFSGVELHLSVEPPHYDDRLPVRVDKPELNFQQKRIAVTQDGQWQELIRDQPWSMNKRRQMLTGYLHAKMEADEGALAEEGCHGMWELSINRDNHADIRMDRLIALLSKLESKSVRVATLAAAALWGLSTSSGCRRSLAEVGVVPIVIAAIKRSLKLGPQASVTQASVTATSVTAPPEGAQEEAVAAGEGEAEGEGGRIRTRAGEGASGGYGSGGGGYGAVGSDARVTEAQRAEFQRHLMGAFAMLMVDRFCRRPYLLLEPGFDTLLLLCRDLEGYSPEDARTRRESAAKVLTSLIQRDPDMRISLIRSRALVGIMELLNPQGEGRNMVQFCMASLLATMVLDDEAMELIREMGDAPLLFEACLTLLTSTLANLHEELQRQEEGFYPDDDTPSVFDLALGVRLAEAASQAMWGSAYMCLGLVPCCIRSDHIESLGRMGLDCVETTQLPLSRVCHCIAATLASMASDPETAQLMVDCPGDVPVHTLLILAEVEVTEVFERAGHVKASACAGLAFLACHPVGAVGDECMHGPYRDHLLKLGAFGSLLRASLLDTGDPDCDLVVQQAAAIGLMFLSTMAGAVSAPDLALYSSLLVNSNNSEMIEFLMAGMWILLRNPDNRRCLGSAFNPATSASQSGKGMMTKLNDALILHEINDQAHEKAEALRAAHAEAGGKPSSRRTSYSGGPSEPEPAPPPVLSVGGMGGKPRVSYSGGRQSDSGGSGGGGAGGGGGHDPSLPLSLEPLLEVEGEVSFPGRPSEGVRGGSESGVGSVKGSGFVSPGAIGSLRGSASGLPPGAEAPTAHTSVEVDGVADLGGGLRAPSMSGVAESVGASPRAGSVSGRTSGFGGSYRGSLTGGAQIGPGSPLYAASPSFQAASSSFHAASSLHDRRDARTPPAALADDEGALQAAAARRGGKGEGGRAVKEARASAAAGSDKDDVLVSAWGAKRGGGQGGGEPMGQGVKGEGGRAAKEVRGAVAAGSDKDDALVKKLDKQLKDNWGLETLVAVGESWLPAMLEQDASGEATDVPVLKLFEFLVASICLFMVEEDNSVAPRGLDMFKLSAPPGVQAATWWTVDVHPPDPPSIVEVEQQRALEILLGVLTLWNVCARNTHMERLVAEHGACTQLLDIVNRPSWPPSLRDIAGGCLSFFCESYVNMKGFPVVVLPAEVAAQMQPPPAPGLVPTLAAYINLVNSGHPLLEYRGSHAIARLCYAAPYGVENARQHIRDAKAVTAILGGIDALFALLKRVNKRYQDMVTGVRVLPKPQAMEDDATAFERDMTGLEAQQDIYFVLFSALLNISVLKPVQPMVAKKGLLILLGTNTLLHCRLAAPSPLPSEGGAVQGQGQAAGPFVVAAGEAEEKLLHLCSCIIQNLSLHPQNRTRMYKAELQGSVALDKLIEDAIDIDQDESLMQMAAMLPPLGSQPASRDSYASLTLTRSSLPSSSGPHSNPRRRTAGSPDIGSRRTGAGWPGSPHGLSQTMSRGEMSSSPVRGMANRDPASRARRRSPNGRILNASMDTAAASTVRPKVLFPTIVDRREEVPHTAPTASRTTSLVGRLPTFTHRTTSSGPPYGEGEDHGGYGHPHGQGHGHDPSPHPHTHMQGHGGGSGTPGQLQRLASGGQGAPGNGAGNRGPAPGLSGSMRGEEDSSFETRNRFLTWMDNAFADEGRGRGGAGGRGVGRGGGGGQGREGHSSGTAHGKRTFRRQMWDEKGDWLDAEPESARALHQILRRPITQMWSETPEARARHGQARWQPLVSEYHEASGEVPLSRPAARLLSTAPPTDQMELFKAAKHLVTTGTAMMSEEDLTATEQRPGTSQRSGGRMSLTVLKPNPDTLRNMAIEGEEWGMGREARLQGLEALAGLSGVPGGSPRGVGSVGGMGGRGPGALPGAPGGAMGAGGQALGAGQVGGGVAAAEGGGDKGSKGGANSKKEKEKEKDTNLPLKVCLGPKRPRQVISFEDRIISSDDPTRPLLTLFEHVEGSRVGQDLFPSYQLPNGKQTYMYYNGGTLLDEVHVDAVTPPPRPSTVPAALQQTMPLADVLSLISKPPGTSPPFIPYKPVPYLVPLPSKHTLTVKHPQLRSASAFGDLREDNMQLILHAKKIIDTRIITRLEDVEVHQPEYREPWSLPMSIFKPRVKEADTRNFLDSEQTEERTFEKDWARACAKEKFTAMMCRENKSNKSSPKEDSVMLKEVHDVLLQYYKRWYAAFLYYAGGGSGDPFHMPLNAWTNFLDDCQIADPESQYIKRSDCDTIFIVCNFQPDKKSAEAQVNLENAMMRYEFLEALVRAALAKFGKGQATDDVAVAVRMLLENHLVANLPPGASLWPNDFREQRLYCEEVDLVFKRHVVMLKALYSRYRLKPPGGGLRSKAVKLEGWQQLMTDASLVDGQFTLQDSALAFLWSRMLTVDEIKDYNKYTSLTFIDFLEALGRVADMKSLPLESELEAAGYNNILEWSLDKERAEGDKAAFGASPGSASNIHETPGEGGTGGSGDGGDSDAAAIPAPHSAIFRRRESAGFDAPKSRPLYAKLELLLDLLFRRLYWDPTNAELPFNYDALLKLVKKVDKDLGP